MKNIKLSKKLQIGLIIFMVFLVSVTLVYAASHTNTDIFGFVENGTTSTLVRVCGTGSNQQIRAENISPGPYWISQIYNYTLALNNSCSPNSPYGWRLVVDGHLGDHERIFSTLTDRSLSEEEFMRLARRDDCTVTSLGHVSCSRIPDYPLEVYNDVNYANTWCYSSTPGSDNVHTSCNDNITSLILLPGWSVRLFKNQNQSGSSACFTSSDNDLRDNTFSDGSSMQDAISSFTLYHQSNCSTPPPADTILPNGYVVAPADGATIDAGTIHFSANAWDNVGGSGVDKVEFHIFYDGVWHQVGVDNSYPYQVDWQTPVGLTSQELLFTIHVIDKAGNQKEDPGGYHHVSFVATPPADTTNPSGKVTNPANNSAINGISTVHFTADAWDNAGGSGVDYVDFYIKYDGSWHKVATDNTSPYQADWQIPVNLRSQQLIFTIHITDKAGNTVMDPGGYHYVQYTATLSIASIINAARADIDMPYNAARQPFCGSFGPWESKYGVCTDLVIDAYLAGTGGIGKSATCGTSPYAAMGQSTGGINLESLVRADYRTNKPRYRWGSARNANDLRIYFSHNQTFLLPNAPWEVGDIAFFDWDPADGIADHVALISRVDGNHLPTKMVHAPGGGSECNAYTGNACETDFGNLMQWVMGHGRMSTTAPRTTENTTAITTYDGNYLKITVNHPDTDITLFLRNTAGKYAAANRNNDLLASNNETFIPYIPYSEYEEIGDTQQISYYRPDAANYAIEITGKKDTDYTLTVQTFNGTQEIAALSFAKTIAANASQKLNITLTANDAGNLEVYAPPPSTVAQIEMPEVFTASGTAGGQVTLTWDVSETSGLADAGTLVVTPNGFTTQMGKSLNYSVISSNAPLLQAGQTATLNVRLAVASDTPPGLYNGALTLVTSAGGSFTVPVMLNITNGNVSKIYLPLVMK